MPHSSALQPKKPSVLSRIGQGLISFGRDVPVSQLEQEQLDNSQRRNQVQIGKQQIAQNEQAITAADAEAQRQQQIQSLSQVFIGGGADSQKALDRLMVIAPEIAEQQFESAGARTAEQRANMSFRAGQLLAVPPEQRDAALEKMAVGMEAEGRDATATRGLIGLPPDEQDASLRFFASAGKQNSAPADVQTFEAMTKGLSAKDRESARRIDLGLDPRAVGSGTITTATTPGLTDQVADSAEIINERRKFGEKTGASRATAIDKGMASITNIDKNIRNLDRAATALQEGASTGAIESRFFPSLRESTIQLEQLQKELALDVIGAVTFGALSQGELDLAKEVALPTGLQPEALLEYIQGKRDSQEKLRDYYFDQVDFLDQGGTIAGFLRQQRRGEEQAQQAGRFTVEEQ